MLFTGDGVRRWSILVPTAAMPRPLRVRARERLLARHELGKAERADLIMIGHPKCGNTWLKVLLSRLYQVRHGLPETMILKSDELATHDRTLPRITATNGYYSYEGIVGRALDADAADSPLRHKPVMFLARNPCDIAVSWYFQFTKRQSARKQELINHFIEHPIDRHSIGMWDFVRHSDIGLPFLIDYLNTWERNTARLENARIIRYEDLRSDPGATLREIAELMGEQFSDAEIEEAVRFGSFDNLRQLESKGFFVYGGLARRDTNDPETFKVRRGKVNGYRDYFTEEQAAEMEALVRERLSPTFGYLPAAEIEPPERREAAGPRRA